MRNAGIWVVLLSCVLLLAGCMSTQERSYWLDQGKYMKEQRDFWEAKYEESVKNAEGDRDFVRDLFAKVKSGEITFASVKGTIAEGQERALKYDELAASAKVKAGEYANKIVEIDEKLKGEPIGKKVEAIFWGLLGMTPLGVAAAAYTKRKTLIAVRDERGPSSAAFKTDDGKLRNDGRCRE